MKTIEKRLAKENPERVEAFKEGAAKYAKKIVANFKDFDFYTGQSMSLDGMVALLNYRVSLTCAPTLTKKTDRTSLSLNQADGVTRMYRSLILR